MKKLIILTALVSLAAACTEDTETLSDGGTVPPPPADSGIVPQPDAGIMADAGELEDAGTPPPARHLTSIKLFGDMPIENAVFNPQFDLAAQTWFGVGDFASGGTFVRVQRRDFARTPVGMPVLAFPFRATDPADTYILGTVMSVASPITASIWIGRTSSDAASLGDVRPSLYFMSPSTGDEKAYDLAVDPMTPQQTLDGIVWQRYSADIADPSLGIITIAIQDPMHETLFMHAPTVLSQPQALLSSNRIVVARKLTANETTAAKIIADKRRKPDVPPQKPKSRSLKDIERRILEDQTR